MKVESLMVFPRTLKKRIGVKKLRNQARVPAVIYGSKTKPQNLEVEQKEIMGLYSKSASEMLLVELTNGEDAGEAKRLAILQELQHHPLTGEILHVDLREVSADEEVEVSVSIEPEGEAAGVKSGGVLDQSLQKVRLRGVVAALPEIITVDVSALEEGDSIHIKDLVVPKGVEILADDSLAVFSVTTPMEEEPEEPAEGEEGAMAEPEVIREKKQTEE
ncbi:MAG TPA: 50S ribosomal protein L25 [Verrucomicrobiota bacterium]|jgi:large subunit ribosomal protein L25|nr:50S ribosomal protein L25 [Verrucomicrobiota bacterium]